ncbi:hypothetical protein [Panacagrimonas perspica]|nr:hypothetical protein [Panacagrimonas perspica]
MSGTLKLKVGSIVQARNSNYRIERIIDPGQWVVFNLETHRTEMLEIGDLALLPGHAQRRNGRPDASKVSAEKWAKAEKTYDVIEALMRQSTRTVEDVEKVAEKLKMSVPTVYRRLRDARTLESPVAMMRKTRLENPTLGFDLLPEGKSPENLEQLVVYVARTMVRFRAVRFPRHHTGPAGARGLPSNP